MFAYFDRGAFAADIIRIKAQRNVTWDTISGESGVGDRTLKALRRVKYCPSANTLAALCFWGDLDPRNYFRERKI